MGGQKQRPALLAFGASRPVLARRKTSPAPARTGFTPARHHFQRGRRGRDLWPAPGPPAPVDHPPVQGRAEPRPWGAHVVQAPGRPASETRVLFELGKAPCDDFLPSAPERLRRRLTPPRAHGLHDRGGRPHFELPALGITRAVSAHGAVAAVAATASGPPSFLGGRAFVSQLLAARPGDGVGARGAAEVLGGAGVVACRGACGGRDQHGHFFFRGGGPIGPRPVAGVGHAQIFARLFHHRRALAAVVFVARGGAGHADPFLGIGPGRGVVGGAVLVAPFHPARCGFAGVMGGPAVGRQWGQARLALLAPRLARGQPGGRVQVRVFRADLQLGLGAGGGAGGAEFFPVLLASAGGGAGGGLDFRAGKGLQSQAHAAGAPG